MKENVQVSKQKKMPKPIGKVPAASNQKSVEFLNQLLADEYALFTKTLNYHWNITGPQFHSLHIFLEEHYRDLLDVMDDVAERVRVLGAKPLGTVEEINKINRLEDHHKKELNSNQMLEELMESHLKIQESLKTILAKSEAFESDPGTEDFIVGVLKNHEMKTWMLRSHLVQH